MEGPVFCHFKKEVQKVLIFLAPLFLIITLDMIDRFRIFFTFLEIQTDL